ncbi:hypothetical protein [Flectobacillus major]|jgi:hypothetical protein|uniref:hypothetical protein n=1 Tax=Flectobacillus major TaxID=103 RepID=UPI0005C46B38|nr:hypothetical protein [Flectobacillus major]
MSNPRKLAIQSIQSLAFERKPLTAKLKVITFTVLGLVFTSTLSKAQQTNSPYSFLGVGEPLTEATSINSMMGGLGVASATGLYVNTLNPALLARNRYTMFEMGVSTEKKNMQNFTKRSDTYRGTLGPISLALPVSSRWTMLLGLRPATNVDYQTFTVEKLDLVGADSTTKTYNGSGGLNKAIFSNGFRIKKNVYVGLETAITFGVINRDITTQNWSDGQRYQIKLADRSNYSGVLFKLGGAWRPQISKKYFLNIGGTVDFAQSLNVNTLKQFRTLDASGLTAINADTLSNVKGASITLPATYRFGVSLEKPGQLMVSLDYSTTKWTNFKNVLGDNDNLKNAYTVALGAEYIPDFEAISGYFNHVVYRAGVSYTESPYTLTGNTAAKDYNFSVGASLPLRTISYLNIAFVHGKRGVLGTNGLEEQYNKIVVGFSLGDFSWFRKPKID